MKAEIVSIPTGTSPMDGLFYDAIGPAKGAVLLMHGSTMNFYVGPPRWLPPHLTKAGFACLAFNRRGHDMLSTCDSREPVGAAFQTVAQGSQDNDIAADWLSGRGFKAPIAIGHSLGAALAVKYTAENHGTPALVVMSAPVGGPGHMERAGKAGMFGGERHEELKARADALVAAGKGRELLSIPGWPYIVSAQHYADNCRNFPSILDLAEQIRCPSLVLAGDQEPEAGTPTAAFAKRCKGACEHHVIGNCGHFYLGREDFTAKLVTDWLVRTLG